MSSVSDLPSQGTAGSARPTQHDPLVANRGAAEIQSGNAVPERPPQPTQRDLLSAASPTVCGSGGVPAMPMPHGGYPAYGSFYLPPHGLAPTGEHPFSAAQRAVGLCVSAENEALPGPGTEVLESSGDAANTGSNIGEPAAKRAARALDFAPATAVASRKFLFNAPEAVTSYVEKYFRSPLSDEQRKAMHEDHPRPDTAAAYVPKVDDTVLRWAGSRFPKTSDSQWAAVQRDVASLSGPVACMLSALVEAEEGVPAVEELSVPSAEVKDVLQRTLVLVGDLMASINGIRRQSIIEAVDKDVARVTKGIPPPGTGKELFGEEFISAISTKVKSEATLNEAQRLARKPQPKPGFQRKGFAFQSSRTPKLHTFSSRQYGRDRQQPPHRGSFRPHRGRPQGQWTPGSRGKSPPRPQAQ